MPKTIVELQIVSRYLFVCPSCGSECDVDECEVDVDPMPDEVECSTCRKWFPTC